MNDFAFGLLAYTKRQFWRFWYFEVQQSVSSYVLKIVISCRPQAHFGIYKKSKDFDNSPGAYTKQRFLVFFLSSQLAPV